jgi:hypothetical protein
VDDSEQGPPSFVWEVGSDLIDLDHWARSYVAVRVEEKQGERPRFVRYGFWPIMATLVVVVGATDSIGRAAACAFFLALAFVGAKLWNRSAASRLARRLRGLPAASEPFTFRADSRGTESRSASGSEHLAWSRYQSVRTYDDFVVLNLDVNLMRLLPIGGLVSGQPASAAVDVIAGWIGGPDRTPQ